MVHKNYSDFYIKKQAPPESNEFFDLVISKWHQQKKYVYMKVTGGQKDWNLLEDVEDLKKG